MPESNPCLSPPILFSPFLPPPLERNGHDMSYSYSNLVHRRRRTSQSTHSSCHAQRSWMTNRIIHLEREPLRAWEVSLPDAPWSCPVEIPALLKWVIANRPFRLMKVILHIPELHARSSHLEIRTAILNQ